MKRLLAIILIAFGGASGAAFAQADADAVARDIAWQIQNLGNESPVLRKLAFEKLARYGAAAGEALVGALDSPQRAVVVSARELLERMPRACPQDPPEVAEALRDYGSLRASERGEIAYRLTALPIEKSAPALLRLIAFDSNDVVAWQLATRLRPWVSKCRDTILAAKLPPRPATLRLQAWAQPERATELLERAWSLARQRLRRGADEYATPLLDLATRELTTLYRQQKRFDAMERCWRELADETRDAEAVLNLLGLLLERDQPQRVEAEWKRYADRLQGDARGLYLLARVATVQGDKERERGLTATALSLWPREPQSHFETAYYLLRQGWLRWAESELQRVVELTDPQHSYPLKSGVFFDQFTARSCLAGIYGHLKQRDKEAEQLETAVRIHEAMQQRGEGREEETAERIRASKCRLLLIEAEKQEKAGNAKSQEKALRDALKLSPHQADVVIALVTVLRKRGAGDEATALIEASRAHFRNVIAKHTKEAENCNNLAWLLANTDSHLDEARQLSHKSLELEPDNAAYLDTLAEVYLRLGQPQRAVELQKQAVELEPESLDLLDRLKKFEAAAAKPQIPNSKLQ